MEELKELARKRGGCRRLWERTFKDACLFADAGIAQEILDEICAGHYMDDMHSQTAGSLGGLR